jgi:Zinc finger, C3HC4 type (RING finger)
MPLKRKRSNSVVDLTTNASLLPVPLTARPRGSRANSLVSSLSSGSHSAKRRRQKDSVVDVDAFSKPTKSVAGTSRLPREVIDVEDQASPGRDDDRQDSFDSGQVANLTKEKHAHQRRSTAAGRSKPSTSTDPLPTLGSPSTPPPSNLLSTHACPICFSAVTSACLTPCGHVMCGACLFAATRSGIQRALSMGIPIGGDGTNARYVVGIQDMFP